MFEGLKESAHQFKEQILGHIAVDRYMVVSQSHVVNWRIDLDHIDDSYIVTELYRRTEIPYLKVGPFNTPFLNHAAEHIVDIAG